MSAPCPGLHVVLGSGPVGRAVAVELLRHPDITVRIASRSGRSVPGAEAVVADLSNPGDAERICAGAKTVTFATAPAYTRWPRDFPRLQEAAVRGAQAADAVLVAVENLYGYGRAGLLSESGPFEATTRKGKVRAAMSDQLMAAHAAGNIRATAVRASDLFGPDMAVSALGEGAWPALLAKKPIGWIGDPDVPHTFTYLPDFARALVQAGATPQAWGRAWHAPSPKDRTPREVLNHAALLLGYQPPRVRPMPRALLRGLSLVSPVLREVAEMSYQFEAPFHMDSSDWSNSFGTEATAWDDALAATLVAWGATPVTRHHAA